MINTYHQVVQVQTSDCATVLTVTNSNLAPVPPFDAIIIQMNGAITEDANSNAFGSILDYNGAGNYERITIHQVNGNQWQSSQKLLHTYDLDFAVQLIPIVQLHQARIENVLTAQPWDGQLGGVLALEVEDTLYMDAPVAAIEGFRGGASQTNLPNNCTWIINQQSYFYDSDNWRGAPKGEGIGVSNTNQANGRGALANAGGGGNDHNASGGGGGHLSRGGQGGGNDEPATFGCDGDFPGLGGWDLENDLGQRWFMGGAGGAGHQNNNAGSGGARGGGIIYLKAGVIITNGQSIQANGQDAANAPETDGAGGGGAGGTIILLADELIGNLTLELSGGKGGNVNNLTSDRCIAGGGGGAGGALYTNLNTSTTPNLQIFQSGGQPGIATNTPICQGALNGAQSGGEGMSFTYTTLPVAMELPLVGNTTILSSPSLISLCEGEETTLTALVSQPLASLEWAVGVGNNFEVWDIDTLIQFGNAFGNQQTFSFQPQWMDTILVRASFVDACGDVLWLPPDTLVRQANPLVDADITINGLEMMLVNTSIPSNISVEWIFEDGTSFAGDTLIRSDLPVGIYTVSQVVTNDCGMDQQELIIVLSEEAPQAAFSATPLVGCDSLTVLFQNESTGTVLLQTWSFPGGNPSISTEANPIVTYTGPGIYPATLEVSDVYTSNALTQIDLIEVVASPAADFTFSIVNDSVFFENLSDDNLTYLWDFGDGSPVDSTFSPSHVYGVSGSYDVSLTVIDHPCQTVVTQTIEVIITEVSEVQSELISIFPNPAKSQVTIWSNQPNHKKTIQIFDGSGQSIYSQKMADPALQLDVSSWPSGVYWILVDESKMEKLIILD